MLKVNTNKLSDDQIKVAATMYLDGNSLRSIAAYFSLPEAKDEDRVSYVTIHKYLTRDLPGIDSLLAMEVAAALKDNQPMSISKPEVVERVKKSYDMFVNKRMSVTEISQTLGVSFYTTYRDLDRRLVLMFVARKGNVTKQMVEKSKLLMEEHRLSNLTPGSDAYLTENRDHGRFAG